MAIRLSYLECTGEVRYIVSQTSYRVPSMSHSITRQTHRSQMFWPCKGTQDRQDISKVLGLLGTESRDNAANGAEVGIPK